MQYTNTIPAKFISRPNRFVAIVDIQGEICECHVKNTGRCKEILLPGVDVFVNKSSNPKRRTQYDLISAYKGDLLINIDSQAPNKLVHEWLIKNGLFSEPLQYVKPEFKFGHSRMDFYVETANHKCVIEVKGVTLEKDEIAMFPDAPTIRGIRHIHELILAKEQGLESMIFFVIQMASITKFMPNWDTHPKFGEALIEASAQGVSLVAIDCDVGENIIVLRKKIPISLEKM